MKIAIIGGGITGLTAAYTLTKSGHAVTVFERESYLGGLAYGFKEKNWDWHLEGAYHHMFTNDYAILSLAKELGIENSLIIKRPITANFWQGAFHQFDSPMHLLKFNGLSLLDKLRTGALVAFCKLYPFWRSLEGITAKDFFIRYGGKNAWDVIWEPLMTGKFGHLDDTIAASWLWARINKRTPSLVYIEGGFQTLVNSLEHAIIRQGGTVYCHTSVDSISQKKNGNLVVKRGEKIDEFDRVILTTPTPIAKKILPHQDSEYFKLPSTIPHLHAQVLILETKKPILEDIYWLSVIDRSFPFLAVVAHTNFMDSHHYGGNHLTYIGNYLPDGHKYLNMTKEQLLKQFAPYITKISRITNNDLRFAKSYLFTAPYAQPVHQINYSKIAPPLETPLYGVFLANMDSIFPWDRGTNYAVELGIRVASKITL